MNRNDQPETFWRFLVGILASNHGAIRGIVCSIIPMVIVAALTRSLGPVPYFGCLGAIVLCGWMQDWYDSFVKWHAARRQPRYQSPKEMAEVFNSFRKESA